MELMSSTLVLFDVDASTKEDVIGTIADAMDADGRLLDKDGYIADVFKREGETSTAVGFGIATPHAKSTSVKEASLAFMRLSQPMDWDGEQVDVIFQIGVPSPGQEDRHLQILAQLFRHLIHEDFQQKLREATSADEIVALVDVK